MEHLPEFVSNHALLVGAFVVLLAMLVVNLVGGLTADGKAVSVGEAVHLINHADGVVLDVRDTADWERGHIMDAVHAPVGKLAESGADLEPLRERPLIICAATDAVAARAAAVLHKTGFARLHRLRGGIVAWQGENLPLERGA